jgi:hypothetical protein
MPGIGYVAKSPITPDHRPPLERLQSKPPVVELASCLGIRGREHLKAAIEQESVDLVGADSAAGAVGRLDDENLEPAPLEAPSTREPRDTCPHDDRVE